MEQSVSFKDYLSPLYLACTYELCQEVALGLILGISRRVWTKWNSGNVTYHQMDAIGAVVLDTSTETGVFE